MSEVAPTAVPDAKLRAELLAALVESADDAILAKTPDGIIQTWNRGAERIYGYKESEVIGRPAVLLLPPERATEEEEILTRIRSGQRVEHVETTRVRKDGALISVSLTISPIFNARGEIIGASHVARDISEKIRMEAATAQLAAIVDSSEDAIISKNLDGLILTWNSGAERIYGYAAEEVKSKSMSMLLPPDRLEEETEILERLKRGERVDHFETVRVRKDGKRIDVSLTVSPIRDRRGNVQGASHIARDITEKKTFQAQILQTQKLESLGILAGGVAHDFNNLLVGILANASLVESFLPASTGLQEVVSEVVSASERAAALTRQLLAYAGKGRFVTEAVNLSELIREISALVQSSIPPKVQVRLELKDDLPPIEADASQLQQVIMNLVINAGEAIGDKVGLVVVTSYVQDVDEQYARTIWGRDELPPGRYVAVEVHDSGCGMDEATLQKIFDPFFTTKFAGRGLGLAAVLGIVRGHKGALKVYSAPGKGSTFKLFFPVADVKAKTTAKTLAASELAGHGTVLVVDDEALVRNAAQHTLERYGYKVLTAADGQRAIELFRPSWKEIVLVLLDLTMPLLNGEDVMRELRAIDPKVCVLLSSGFNEVEAVRRFTGKGLAGFIQKPYTSVALATKVKQIVDREEQRAKEGRQ